MDLAAASDTAESARLPRERLKPRPAGAGATDAA